MTVSDKAKEKLDAAGKEIKDAVDGLKKEVSLLTDKIKEKFRNAGRETSDSVDELKKEVKSLSDRVKDLIPVKRKKGQVPVRIEHTGRGLRNYPIMDPFGLSDSFLDDFFGTYPASLSNSSPWSFTGAAWPSVNMDETKDKIRITAELPGVDKEDIDISITGDRVTIKGEKRAEDEKKGRDYYRVERFYGSFNRTLQLPCEVDADKTGARFKKGVLTINLPKTSEAQKRSHRIAVSSN